MKKFLPVFATLIVITCMAVGLVLSYNRKKATFSSPVDIAQSEESYQRALNSPSQVQVIIHWAGRDGNALVGDLENVSSIPLSNLRLTGYPTGFESVGYTPPPAEVGSPNDDSPLLPGHLGRFVIQCKPEAVIRIYVLHRDANGTTSQEDVSYQEANRREETIFR